MISLVIEPARLEDAEAMQEVRYLGWLHAYPNEKLGITREMIDRRFNGPKREERLQKQRRNILDPTPGTVFLVARVHGRIIGVSCVSRHDERGDQRLEQLYVHPDHHRSGVGSALWLEGLKHLDRHRPVLVNVVAYNDTAISFYQKHGFLHLGLWHDPIELEGIKMPEAWMIRPPDQTS